MRRKAKGTLGVGLGIILAGVALALWASPALAYPGGCHWWAAEAAAKAHGVWGGHISVDPMEIRRDRPVPVLPELERGVNWYNPDEGCCDEDDWEENVATWDWMRRAAQGMDPYDSDTRHHFWTPEWGLHHSVNDTSGLNNAWESVHEHWIRAIDAWNEGNLGEAYTELGYALHFVQDGGQPAHANDDMHPGDTWSDDDSLEDWITGDYCTTHFDWNADLTDRVIPFPPHSNVGILQDMIAANGGCWDEDCDYVIGPSTDEAWQEQDRYLFTLEDSYTRYNEQQFFYIMYSVNQMGNYFASDSEPGDTWEPIGWLNHYQQINPKPVFNCPYDPETEPPCTTSPHDSDGLDDNDGNECTDDNDNNDDGDLGTIAYWAYGSSMSGSLAVLDLFRRTVDAVPPVSTVTKTRADGGVYKEWNNSPVRVEITSAVDYGNPSFRDSHVYKRWGRMDGQVPSLMDNADQTPYWVINTEGSHPVQMLTVDWIGNVETEASDFVVGIDLTPPDVRFPALQPNYLTSQTFTAIWTATDDTSGVASEVAYLDNQAVAKGQVFNLAQMAGRHSLRVIVYDKADNYRDVSFNFEVWIDANGWCLPVYVNGKTNGEGMTCVVEFPAYYEVASMILDTTRLAVKGYVDLHEGFPVLGETAKLPGLNLTGVGDHDRDGIRDRKIKFDKALFVQALFGQTGNVGSVIYGGLLPDGQRRFLAPVVVPVF